MAVYILASLGAGVRAEGPNVTGMVDVGYNYNLNGQSTNEMRSFDDQSNTITLHNAKIGVDGMVKENVGYKIELMYGHDASVTNAGGFYTPDSSSTETNLEADIAQAYLTFPCPITGAKFTLGKFVTPFGVEVIEAKDNFNISRGLLFGFAIPTAHTGLKADKSLMNGEVTTTVGIVNGWDNMNDNNKGKTAIAQVGTTLLPKTSITLGGAYGSEQNPNGDNERSVAGNGRSLVDAIVKVTPIDSLTIIGNYDIGEEKTNHPDEITASSERKTGNWQGVGVHANFKINDMFSIAGRWETLDDDGTRLEGMEQVLRSETVTLQAKKDDVIYRLEYRADHSTYNNGGTMAFSDDLGNMNRKSQATIGAQVILSF
ncbi:MAG: outer membrane beta-barrel protein [Elusimicrobia bacterium]|mgnify:CR=1 FL=1|nr:outer membrane beta-barrel protein [Elusimicrobiota bacterium]